MTYLLDVNVLIALKHTRSPHHQLCRRWAGRQGLDALATCALTELGFIRVSMSAYDVSLAEAQKDLAELKTKLGRFIEKCPAPTLPAWSGTSGRTTDAYLMQIAKSAAMELATFDTGIPGATVIK
jgi:hypothetical protein